MIKTSNLIFLFLMVASVCFSNENQPQNFLERVKIETYEDAILWFGYEMPEKFDPKAIDEGQEKAKAFKLGLELCEELSINGNRICQETLANYYYIVAKDTRKGLYWANKGAEQGSDICMYILSDAYRLGNGVLKDLEECGKWLYLSAASGCEEAKERITELEKNHPNSELQKKICIKAKEWQKTHPEAFFSPN